MLEHIPHRNIFFLDIETVPEYPSYEDMPRGLRDLWNKKASYFCDEDQTPADVYSRAGIYAEFGKIVCICCGIFTADNSVRICSYSGNEEKTLLIQFLSALNAFFSVPGKRLCAHNGKEFDFPYLCRRMIIQGLKLPSALSLQGKKPWEVSHLDTMELWKFGDFKSYTSLALLATVLDIPTPKDDIDGSRVWEVYWKEKNLDRIVAYCRKDVITIAQVFRRLRGEPLLAPDEIEILPCKQEII